MSEAGNYEHPEKLITELRLLVKKIFLDPSIIEDALNIAREFYGKDDAKRLVAEKISATTNIKIPFDPSEADQMLVNLVMEIVRDEKELY